MKFLDRISAFSDLDQAERLAMIEELESRIEELKSEYIMQNIVDAEVQELLEVESV